MNNFPYFNHWVIKLVFKPDFEFSSQNLQELLEAIIKHARLTVITEFEHAFPHQGLTKVLILSQSHLVCHTWPEQYAIHLDLMTCTTGIKESTLQEALERFPLKQLQIQKLEY